MCSYYNDDDGRPAVVLHPRDFAGASHVVLIIYLVTADPAHAVLWEINNRRTNDCFPHIRCRFGQSYHYMKTTSNFSSCARYIAIKILVTLVVVVSLS